MRMTVQQVMVRAGDTVGIVIGIPVDDETKLVIAGADSRNAQALGEYLVENGPLVLEVPEWAVIDILELPKPPEA